MRMFFWFFQHNTMIIIRLILLIFYLEWHHCCWFFCWCLVDFISIRTLFQFISNGQNTCHLFVMGKKRHDCCLLRFDNSMLIQFRSVGGERVRRHDVHNGWRRSVARQRHHQQFRYGCRLALDWRRYPCRHGVFVSFARVSVSQIPASWTAWQDVGAVERRRHTFVVGEQGDERCEQQRRHRSQRAQKEIKTFWFIFGTSLTTTTWCACGWCGGCLWFWTFSFLCRRILKRKEAKKKKIEKNFEKQKCNWGINSIYLGRGSSGRRRRACNGGRTTAWSGARRGEFRATTPGQLRCFRINAIALCVYVRETERVERWVMRDLINTTCATQAYGFGRDSRVGVANVDVDACGHKARHIDLHGHKQHTHERRVANNTTDVRWGDWGKICRPSCCARRRVDRHCTAPTSLVGRRVVIVDAHALLWMHRAPPWTAEIIVCQQWELSHIQNEKYILVWFVHHH